MCCTSTCAGAIAGFMGIVPAAVMDFPFDLDFDFFDFPLSFDFAASGAACVVSVVWTAGSAGGAVPVESARTR
jgi:hypothetical protein